MQAVFEAQAEMVDSFNLATHNCRVTVVKALQGVQVEADRLTEGAPAMLAMLRRALPWLAKAYVEKIHKTCAAPMDLVNCMRQIEVVIEGVEKGTAS